MPVLNIERNRIFRGCIFDLYMFLTISRQIIISRIFRNYEVFLNNFVVTLVVVYRTELYETYIKRDNKRLIKILSFITL